MPVDSVPAARPPARLRADHPAELPGATPADADAPGEAEARWFDRVGRPAVVAVAAFFVGLGGASFDLDAAESRLGLALREALGPLGRVTGSWDPAVWPLPVAIGQVAGWFEDEGTTQNAVRWPVVAAACLIGYLLTRRARLGLGPRAGILAALAWFGSVAAMDRTLGVGGNLIAGLGTVAALDRLLARGSGWAVGGWAAWAFLAGGWPPVAVLILATVVLGRSGATWTWRTSVPVLAAVAGWSAWCLVEAPAAVWASALALPVTGSMAWTLAPAVLLAGCPWSPFVALLAFRSIREGGDEAGRALTRGWLQVAGAALVVGSIVPGLGPAATVPALAGLAFASAAAWDRLWAAGATTPASRRTLAALTLGIAGAWFVLVLGAGGAVAFAVAYYRATIIVAAIVSGVALACAVVGAQRNDTRRGLIAIALVAAAIKVIHWGYYVPESNYRTSAGPWGRAIGQWVPEGHTLYTLKPWPADLEFSTGRAVRQVAVPSQIAHQATRGSKFVLLSESEWLEYQHWSEGWPKLVKVAEFEDEEGLSHRYLTRTDEPIVLGHPRRKNSAMQ